MLCKLPEILCGRMLTNCCDVFLRFISAISSSKNAEQKCRTPWLADDEKLEKRHWLKHPEAVP